jgi:hypothetical protein
MQDNTNDIAVRTSSVTDLCKYRSERAKDKYRTVVQEILNLNTDMYSRDEMAALPDVDRDAVLALLLEDVVRENTFMDEYDTFEIDLGLGPDET